MIDSHIFKWLTILPIAFLAVAFVWSVVRADIKVKKFMVVEDIHGDKFLAVSLKNRTKKDFFTLTFEVYCIDYKGDEEVYLKESTPLLSLYENGKEIFNSV